MIINPALHELAATWKREAAGLRNRFGDDIRTSVPTLIETLADELLQALDSDENQTVNLTRAAELTGYRPDSLGKLIRLGKLENVGRKNAPLVRVRDLPTRSRTIGCTSSNTVLPSNRASLYRDAARVVVANS